MKYKFITAMSVMACLLFSANVQAQRELEFTLSFGATGVDIEHLVEKDENIGSWATDWGLGSYSVGAKYLKSFKEKIQIGAEINYHYVFWYSVSVPYGSTSTGGSNRIYRDYHVTALKMTPFIRFGTNQINYDVGIELNIMDGLVPGLYSSVLYNIEINEKLSVPLGVRMDLMFGTVPYPFIGFTGGVKLKT